MSIGQYGFDHHKQRGQVRAHRARQVIACWSMGRGHLTDDVDMALAALVRGLDDAPQSRRRRGMVLTLADWIASNPHLPPDLVAAIRQLLPEVDQVTLTDHWQVGLNP